MYGVAGAHGLSIQYCMVRDARLSRSDWLDYALGVLTRDGHDALRSEPLAKGLQVSRGSFYWHFEDVAAFHGAVLERWESAAVDEPLEAAVRRSDGSAKEHLHELMGIAFVASPDLERAVHAWAAVSAVAAEAVSRVNRRRVRLLAKMFENAGTPHSEAEASAVVVYWAYLGRIFCREFPATKARLTQVKRRLGVRGRA